MALQEKTAQEFKKASSLKRPKKQVPHAAPCPFTPALTTCLIADNASQFVRCFVMERTKGVKNHSGTHIAHYCN